MRRLIEKLFGGEKLTDGQLVLVLVVWFFGLVGASFMIFGFYRFAILNDESGFRYVVIGMIISVGTGVAARTIGRRIYKRMDHK